MGKGKKKGGSRATSGIETGVSSLSVEDSASTSQAPVEEEEGGLTGGGRKKKPQKTVAKPDPIVEKKEEKPEEATPAAEPAEECSGLTGGGRKKPAKAKLDPVEAKNDEKPSEPSPATAAKPDPPKVEEDEGGLGLTGGAKKSRPRRKKPSLAAQAAQPGEPGSQAGQPGLPAGQPGIPAGQSGPPGVQPGPPGVQPGPPGVQPGPPGVQPGPPGVQPGPAGFQPGPQGPQYASQPGAPLQQAGRPAPAAAPAAGPWQRSVSAPQAPVPAGQATGAVPRPQQTTQSAPPKSGLSGPPVKYEPLPKSRLEQACQHVIPGKILGNSVQCRMVKVLTNYLPMTIKPMKVHRYDFSFTPDKPRKWIPDVYKMLKDRCFPKEVVAFDMFKNAYSLTPLKNIVSAGSDIVNKVDYTDPYGRVVSFKVIIKYTGTVDFSHLIRHMQTQGSSLSVPMDVIQCMDVILRQGSLESYVKCGRNFFRRPDRPIDLSGGLEIWTGLFQSAIFTTRPFINVDVAHKGFPIHQPMLTAMKAIGLDCSRSLEQQPGRAAETFKDFVKGLRVVCQQVGGPSMGQTREYIVNMVKEPPTSLTFIRENEGGRTITVYDYYLREYKYKIKYPHLPCLWVGPRDRTVYYPVELCTVGYGQALRKQLNEFQLSTMVREAATPPDERLRKIEEVARSMNYSQNVLFKKFGLEISNQFLEVEAKVLQAPTLNCGENRPTYPSRGAWNSQKLLKPEALVSWGFIGVELSPNACNFEGISSLLLQTGTQLGMEVTKPRMHQFNVTMRDLRALLFKALEQEIRFLFVIVPMRIKDCYHKVKQFAETDVGILTQCIKEQTATRRMNHQTIKNILLKVNSKLMGINQCLANVSTPRCINAGNVMIVGADVTHPSPDQQNIPSIAAVTASMDPKCFVYHIELSIQSPKAEVISDFEEMMCDHLKLYIQKNGRPPKKIYVFRDGVSEGQFKAVINRELSGLIAAYARFSKEKPEVLFLLVQKRHHTRLFGTDSRTRKIVNVEPGTVVDTHIVHPKELDFYMVSHAAIKGTARPTRYHSVCNDGSIPQDEVEQLTYYLCHLYSRCMRAVSYPTPTYYAHLACLRARSLTYGTTFNNVDLETKGPQRLRVLDRMLRSSLMFFV